MTILTLNVFVVLAIMTVLMLQWLHNQQPQFQHPRWSRYQPVWRPDGPTHNDCVRELIRKSTRYMGAL